MNVYVKNKEGRPMAADVKRRAWSRYIPDCPSFYRARIWPYKGRRTLVKTYPNSK